jgi:AcrR family transcriptional regulator
VQRAEKKELTRDALVRAAYRLFVERGVDHVTIDDIAEASGVSRRTFFRYFPTKEDVVFPDHHLRVEQFKVLLDQRVEGETGFGAVKRAALAMGAIFQEVREELLVQHRVVSASTALTGLEMMLDRRYEEAMVRAVVQRDGKGARRRAGLIAAATLGVVRAVLRDWFERGCKGDLIRIGEEAFAMLEEGFGPLKRSKR